MEYKKNSQVEIEITDTGVSGEGIGKIDGFTLFVKDAVQGDKVLALLTKVKKNYAYARCEKVLVPSPFRIEPRCPIYKPCGGCQLQAVAYDKQLQIKQQKVFGNLQRIGGFAAEGIESVMEPIVGMDDPYHYRNKAQYPIGVDKDGNPVAGFYAGRTHSIIPGTDCCIGAETDGVILREILAFMKRYQISAYQEESGRGLVRHVLIRTGFTTGEIMVCLVKKLPHEQELISSLTKLKLCENMKESDGAQKNAGGTEEKHEEEPEKQIVSISLSINQENTNVIMGKEIRLLYGKPYITDYIGDVAFQISPLSFFQVNPVQTKKLYGTALAYADLQGKETVWDLYCGIGTISLFLAQKAKAVYGVEIVPQAIEDARKNAALNHMENATFFVGKAEEVLPDWYAKHSQKESEMAHPDVIVVDPPRKGCDEKCLDTMLKMQPDRIVYVSCDSATLARDLRILVDGGYTLQKVRPVDMFPMSVHVETVVLLSKGEVDSKKIRVEFSLEDMDMSEFQDGATYPQIKEYVLEHTGLKVSSLYISQIKRKCGLEVGKNYNLPKSEDSRQPQCPPEKEKAIREAFKYFGMI